MKNTQALLLIGIVTGCLALLALIIIPGEGGQIVLGFSTARWLLLLWVTAGVFAISCCLFALRYRPEQMTRFFEAIKNHLIGWKYCFALCMSIFGFCVGLVFLWIFFSRTNQQITPLFIRLMPAVLWSAFLCLEIALYLIWFSVREGRPGFFIILREIQPALWRRRIDLIIIIGLSLVILAVFAPVFQVVGHTSGSDYVAHVRQAQRMDERGVNMSSYFLYQMFVIAAHRLFPDVEYLTAGIWVVVLFQVILGWVLYTMLRWSLRRAFEDRPVWASVLSGSAALCLLLVAPLSLLTWSHRNMYFGYIGINVYHSPTIVLLKPLALILFMAAVMVFSMGNTRQVGYVRRTVPFWVVGGITLLCGLAKPNYIITLLPALGVYVLLWMWQKKKIDWLGLVGGIGLPAVALLAWQYLATYTQSSVFTDEAGIIFAPFLVYGRESEHLFVKFVMSIAFPLSVYMAYFSHAWRDWTLNLAWLTFVFGAFFTYFFAESGPRLQDANFAWCGQVTLFILYAASAAFFLNQAYDRRSANRWRDKSVPFFLCVSVFGLQLICGIWWFWLHLNQPTSVWW